MQELPPRYISLKICFACSPGGHLAQLEQLRSWWEHHERFWIVPNRDDTRALLPDENLIQPYYPTTRSLLKASQNFYLSLWTLRREKPDVVVSTGAGIAVPVFLAAKILRIPTVYIEGFGRIDEVSMSGRLCHPMSNLLLVQWRDQKQLFRRSQYVGPIYSWVRQAEETTATSGGPVSLPPPRVSEGEGLSILVTVGTDHHPFDRLIEWTDTWARSNPGAEVVVQHGFSSPPANTGRNIQVYERMGYEQLSELMQRAAVVVTHAGGGSVSQAWKVGRQPIVVPREALRGEHVDDHQLGFARRLSELHYPLRVAWNYEDFAGAIEEGLDRGFKSVPKSDMKPMSVVTTIGDLIEKTAASGQRPRPRSLCPFAHRSMK